MAIDTPARLAILGAGPIGLESALYARFLGYDVVIYEQGEVAASVRQWGHVRMFTPFADNRTTLGLAAIQAQDESYQPPSDDALLTGQEWLDRYLLPLAATDLLSDHLRQNTTVIAVGKEELLQADLPGHEDRGDWSFRVLYHDPTGKEQVELFDGVLDCTGVFGRHNWLGHGGMRAIGEVALNYAIEHRLPDIPGNDRPRYAGKRTLLVGAGMSAATNVVALAELATQEPGTRVTWITRREGPAASGGPITVIENDPLPARAALARQANDLAAQADSVTYWPKTVVEKLHRNSPGEAFEVTLSGDHAGPLLVNEIIANVGFRPCKDLHEELQVSTNDWVQRPPGPQGLLNPEPNFYILGSKSFGRRSDFLLSAGYEQIRDVFTLIGDRATLDLYSGAKQLIR
jgi:thioredoxin reductase